MLLLDPGCSVLKRALCAAHVHRAPYTAASVHHAYVQRALHCAGVLGSTLVVLVGAWWAACAHHGGPLALGAHTTPHCHRPLAPSQWAAVSQSQHYLPPDSPP